MMTNTTHSAATPPVGAQRNVRRRAWPWRLLALAVSVLAALVAAEVGLRVTGLGYGFSPLLGHPVLHHWSPSNYRMRVYSPRNQYGGFDACFNSLGMPMSAEPPPADEPSLVFLGDSFTAGKEVAEKQRFAVLTSEKLQLPLVNLGCSTFSPLLETLAFEHFADRLQPRAVVLQLYANDLEGDGVMAGLADRDAAGKIVAVPGDRTPWHVRLGRRVYLVRLVNMAWRTWSFERQMRGRVAGDRDATAWAPYFAEPITTAASDAQRGAFESSLLRLRDDCRARGCPLLVFAVPDRGALRHGQPDYFSDYVAEFATREEIGWLDLRPAFAERDPGELFYPQDIHFNPAGHALTAELLAARLEGLLGEAAVERE